MPLKSSFSEASITKGRLSLGCGALFLQALTPGTDYLVEPGPNTSAGYLYGYGNSPRFSFFLAPYYYHLASFITSPVTTSDIHLFSSSDGIHWKDTGIFLPNVDGRHFSIWFDGAFVHMIYINSSGNFMYMRGTPSAGTVSWSAAQTIYAPSSPYSATLAFGISICKTTNGYLWVGFQRYDSSNGYYYIDVAYSTNNGVTWSAPLDIDGAASNMHGTLVLPLTSSSVMIIWNSTSSSYPGLNACTWNGTSLGPITTLSLSNIWYDDYSAVSVNGVIYLVFTNDSDQLVYTNFTTSWSSQVIIVPNCDPHTFQLSYSPITGALVVYYLDSVTGDVKVVENIKGWTSPIIFLPYSQISNIYACTSGGYFFTVNIANSVQFYFGTCGAGGLQIWFTLGWS